MIEQLVLELKHERDKLDRAISALTVVSVNGDAPKRTMSASARRRISKAMKARWAAKKAPQPVRAYRRRQVA